jgi:hypothetical protein
MFGNPEFYNSDKKDIAQQHHIDLKKGEGALNPQTAPGSLRLIWDPPPLPPTSPCAVVVSPLAHVELFNVILVLLAVMLFRSMIDRQERRQSSIAFILR